MKIEEELQENFLLLKSMITNFEFPTGTRTNTHKELDVLFFFADVKKQAEKCRSIAAILTEPRGENSGMTGLVFSKKRMIERLKKEGREAELTEEILKIMDVLDGRDAEDNCWRRVVYEEAVYFVTFPNGHPPTWLDREVEGKVGEKRGEYVNEKDCIPKEEWNKDA